MPITIYLSLNVILIIVTKTQNLKGINKDFQFCMREDIDASISDK